LTLSLLLLLLLLFDTVAAAAAAAAAAAVICCCCCCGPQVKVFQLSSGFCYVTFSEHTAPVTAVAFLPSGSAVLSASLDGSVRAYDLLRYR
jgi:periodic tryptophan protein 2